LEAQKIEECLAVYQDLKANNKKLIEQGVHDYSLINSLLKANDEVRLHSRFIYSMINPNGLHYCDNKFLKVFLDLLPDELKNFIDPENARIFKEKGKIDLLIHDDNNFLIVENKLSAVDQKYQITRYIQYVQKEFFEDGKDISSNIVVVYLSKSRKEPSQDSKSLIGFRLEGGMLHWKGLPDGTPANDLQLLSSISFPRGAKIPFVHFSYFPMLQNWAIRCAELAPPDGRKNAFEEYQKILERLNTDKPWRKILSLDQYALSLSKDEQKKIYELMVESRKRLADFVAQKLFSDITRIFGEKTIKEHGKYKLLTVTSIKNWLQKNGNKDGWKDIGFIISGQNNQRVGFVLAVDFAYFGTYDVTNNTWSAENKSKNRILGKDARELLLDNPGGIYMFIDEIEKKKKALNLGVELSMPEIMATR
jgi:hypothetical protein